MSTKIYAVSLSKKQWEKLKLFNLQTQMLPVNTNEENIEISLTLQQLQKLRLSITQELMKIENTPEGLRKYNEEYDILSDLDQALKYK